MKLDRRLQEALGVTRVARITGLDRAGVEVASAIRPGGHVLQVCNGKGVDWESARLGALLETAELFCAERPDPVALRHATEAELVARYGEDRVWGPGVFTESGRRRFAEDPLRLAWCEADELFSSARVWVPAQLFFCPPSSGPALGMSVLRWSSNGMGAHPDVEAALVHALLEATERDRLARALPQGFTVEAVASRLVGEDGCRKLPRYCEAAARLHREGLEAHLFGIDAMPGLVTLAVVLVDHDGPIPMTAGYACRTTADDAALAALLEAAQSRLTDIHGAREDVSHADPEDATRMEAMLADARPVSARWPPDRPPTLDALLDSLDRLGVPGVAALRLGPEDFPVHVVKVLVPGFLVSELL